MCMCKKSYYAIGVLPSSPLPYLFLDPTLMYNYDCVLAGDF